MKSFMLKLFCFMLIVSTTLFIGTACKNEEDAVSQGLEFESSSDRTGYAVAGIGECFDTKIIIPSTYKSKPVVEIKRGAFTGDNLTSIIIPNRVTSIGYSAFSGCTSLTSVTIGNSVKSIGDYAFYACNNLRSITIGNSVTSIGYSAFNGCASLTSVTIPNSVTSIGDYAFSGCPIETATIPTTVIAVIKNKSLETVILTGGTWIVDYAFSACTNLTSITIPDSVTSIGSYAFSGCTSLTSITIPNGVTSIGACAFAYCDNLTSITYNGTKSEWNSISKGSNWAYGVKATYVTCTDGKVYI